MIEKKSLLVVIVVAMIVLTGVLVLFNDYSLKTANYQGQIQQLHQKADTIDQQTQSTQDLKNYVSSLAKERKQETLVNQLTDCAAKNQVEIIDITPEKMVKEKNYISTEVSLRINASSFKNLLLFLQTIETPPYSLKVEYWSGKLQDPDKGSITCEMNIASIQIKK